jgi:hypothetical protein
MCRNGVVRTLDGDLEVPQLRHRRGLELMFTAQRGIAETTRSNIRRFPRANLIWVKPVSASDVDLFRVVKTELACVRDG